MRVDHRERDERGRLKKGKKNYQVLLDNYPEVKEWAEARLTKPNTKHIYLFNFHKLLEELKLSPKELLESENPRRRIMSVVDKYRKDKSSVARLMKFAVQDFFDYYERDIDFRKKDKISVIKKKIIHEYIPTKDDIYAMVDAAGDERDAAMILCLFQSGVRIHCLLNWKYKHIKNVIDDDPPIPIKITTELDTKISQTNNQFYYTFLGEEAVRLLRKYLELRKSLNDNDPVFVQRSNKSKSITYLHFYRTFKRIIKDTKTRDLDPNNIWPHTLRKSFRMALLRGGIDFEISESLMGHTLPSSSPAYVKLQDIDYLKEEYEKGDFSPVTSKTAAPISRVERLEEDLKKREEEIAQLREMVEELRKGPEFLDLKAHIMDKISTSIMLEEISSQSDMEKLLDKIERKLKKPYMKAIQERDELEYDPWFKRQIDLLEYAIKDFKKLKFEELREKLKKHEEITV